MKHLLILSVPVSMLIFGCGSGGSGKKSEKNMTSEFQVKLVTVDPGHFHAALVQKKMYPGVSHEAYVYAPEGSDLEQHLQRIEAYNSRSENPTSWKEIVYTEDDFFETMIEDNKGNVVVLSGNNRKKAEYIARSVNAGLNVLADKPMIILPEDFSKLENAFRVASEKGVLLYDIMTERYEITTIMQKLLSQKQEIFGSLVNGTPENPAVSKVSVHHFSKMVSGVPLIRPAWFFDVEQQGEGIVDVTTHLVDLIQWECFPEQILTTSDVSVAEARRWPTVITRDEFKAVTGFDNFPSFLEKDVKNSRLHVYSNGEMVYRIKDIWAKVSVEWKYQAPPGGGDTHYSVMRGTLCDLVIRQGAEEKYVPTLYIENIKEGSVNNFTIKIQQAVDSLQYKGIRVEAAGEGRLKLNIPDNLRVGHEEHFGQVTEKFLEYLKAKKLPDWEVAGMITKYYTTTSALKLAKGIPLN